MQDKQETEEAVTDASSKVRKNITVSEELYDEFNSLKEDGESQPELLKRMISTCKENATLRTDNARMMSDIEMMVKDAEDTNEQLRDINEQLKDLRSGSSTAVTHAGQSSFSDFGGGAIKETMEVVRDVCDDEAVCAKTALHLLDTKAALVSKQIDRDHSADQKQLDREDKEKDRQLKIDLAERRAQHEKEMSMIKKGIVNEADLEGTVFLGSMQKRKTAKERLADMKNRAYHAADGEEDELGDPDPPEYEDDDHA